MFGLENNCPEAIRLGEHMMSENEQRLSPELAMAVKNYLLANNERYQQAVKKTGPIDNSTLYKKGKKQHSPVIHTMDDPYWKEFMERNMYKRTTQWKIPSAFAWNHKPYGIFSEVIDMQKLEQTQKELQNMSFTF